RDMVIGIAKEALTTSEEKQERVDALTMKFSSVSSSLQNTEEPQITAAVFSEMNGENNFIKEQFPGKTEVASIELGITETVLQGIEDQQAKQLENVTIDSSLSRSQLIHDSTSMDALTETIGEVSSSARLPIPNYIIVAQQKPTTSRGGMEETERLVWDSSICRTVQALLKDKQSLGRADCHVPFFRERKK
ncbi:hypothetical protein KI387_015553, partial [Taxus chinensis]